jgi:hypothetical protein
MLDYAKIADNEHCVYVLWAVLNDRVYAKVGMSSYLGQRIIQVCQGVPFDMSGGIILKGVNRYHVKEIELAMHKRLAEYRARGEWFVFPSESLGIGVINSITWDVSLKHNMERTAVDVDAMTEFYRSEVNASKPKKKYKTVKQGRDEAMDQKRVSTAMARAQRLAHLRS